MIEKADSNRDGKVSFDDFYAVGIICLLQDQVDWGALIGNLNGGVVLSYDILELLDWVASLALLAQDVEECFYGNQD